MGRVDKRRKGKQDGQANQREQEKQAKRVGDNKAPHRQLFRKSKVSFEREERETETRKVSEGGDQGTKAKSKRRHAGQMRKAGLDARKASEQTRKGKKNKDNTHRIF